MALARLALALVLVLVASCGKSESRRVSTEVPDETPTKQLDARHALTSVKIEDGIGFLTGNYHTSSNNPAMYADPDKHMFVLLGNKSRLEVPLADPSKAIAAFEDFLLLHGYSPNGKTAPDTHQKIMVDGKEMVVMRMDELLPTMPADLRSRFTTAQYDALEHTSGTTGFRLYSGHDKDYPAHPLMFAYTKSISVVGPDTEKDFPIEKASEAFAEYRALLARTKLVP